MKVTNNASSGFQPFSITLTFETELEAKVWRAFIGGVGGKDTTYRVTLNPDDVYDAINNVLDDSGRQDLSEFFEVSDGKITGKEIRTCTSVRTSY